MLRRQEPSNTTELKWNNIFTRNLYFKAWYLIEQMMMLVTRVSMTVTVMVIQILRMYVLITNRSRVRISALTRQLFWIPKETHKWILTGWSLTRWEPIEGDETGILKALDPDLRPSLLRKSRDVVHFLVWGWASVADGGSALNQYMASVLLHLWTCWSTY